LDIRRRRRQHGNRRRFDLLDAWTDAEADPLSLRQLDVVLLDLTARRLDPNRMR
jgi:hypothetical protein